MNQVYGNIDILIISALQQKPINLIKYLKFLLHTALK